MTTETELHAAVRLSVNLLRAYVTRDQAAVHRALEGLDRQRLEQVLAVLIVGHDVNFDELGEPSHSVKALRATAALAPIDAELAVTTAVDRVATGESGFLGAVADLDDLTGQIHTMAVTTAVMLTDALGAAGALQETDKWLRTATT
ncbi:hypothetical protein [Streptodolium elevatio]|uniref:Uncharacterized protein n=1 Tax=Streptodolium elevatio TaxID=3157996 RepID=A0ABV3DTH5_9ACTN